MVSIDTVVEYVVVDEGGIEIMSTGYPSVKFRYLSKSAGSVVNKSEVFRFVKSIHIFFKT